jgi:prolyl 4-hydroxylase
MFSAIVLLLIWHITVLFTSPVICVHGDVDKLSRDSETAAVDTAKQYPWHDQYMKGCYEAYTKELCDENEAIRLERNTHQPSWVPRNYTTAGYALVPAPSGAFAMLREFWDRFSPHHLRPEAWDAANVYTNHWKAPTQLLPVPEDPTREETRSPQWSMPLRPKLVEQVQEVLERWTGVSLQPTSLYGIRSYTNGSILAPHVDRYVRCGHALFHDESALMFVFSFCLYNRVPLVISAIINVAQEVEEDWVLEVIGHDGLARNLTMRPGDMILYESHSIIHGRPYPLNGTFYANYFLHFEPIGYSEEYFDEQRRKTLVSMKTPREKYEAAMAKLSAGKVSNKVSSVDDAEERRPTKASLPDHIPEGTLEAKRWRQEFEFIRVKIRNEKPSEDIFPMIIQRKPKTVGATSAHILAATNDIKRIREIARSDPKSLTVADINGWKPIHEAARGGSTEVLKFLLEEYSVDANERTNGGIGGSPLWLAEKELPKTHAVIKLLRRHGAIAIAPSKGDEKEEDS